MENIGESIGEPIIENDESVPLTIEKKPRKKRETQSTAQLETLKRGREKLAEKRQKQRDAKKQEPVDDMMQKFEKRYNDMLNNIESLVHYHHEQRIIPTNIPEPNDTKTTVPPKIQKFFV